MKKITPRIYAESFFAAAHEPGTHADTLVKNFVELLKKRGDWAHREKIMKAVEDAKRASLGRKLVEIESARKLPETELSSIRKMFHGKSYDFEERVNPELVAGVRLTLDRDQELDGSLQHVLRNLFN